MENLAGSYSDRVLAHFDAPVHAGRLPPGSGDILLGRAESKARSAWVAFELASEAGSVKSAAFRVLGCPHLVAGADVIAGRLEGLDVASLAGFDAGFLDQELPLPPEKLDIRILLEDAVRAAAKPAGPEN